MARRTRARDDDLRLRRRRRRARGRGRVARARRDGVPPAHAGRRRGPSRSAALGRLAVHNALAGAAAGLAAGLQPRRRRARARRAVARRAPLDGDPRGRRRDRRRRYNAAPARSMRAALELLAGVPAARRIAVLGEMRELGDAHDAGHLEVGGPPAGASTSLVVVDGEPGGARPGHRGWRAARPGWRPITPSPRPTTPSATTSRERGPARRRRARQGVAGRGARAGRRRPRRGARRPGVGPVTARADPGPAARVRPRRDPDAALHAPAAPRSASASRSARRARRATWSSGGRRRWAACS